MQHRKAGSTFLFGCEVPPFRTTTNADDDVAEDWIYVEFGPKTPPIEGSSFVSAPYRLTGHYTGKFREAARPKRRQAPVRPAAPEPDCARRAPGFRVTDWCVVLPVAPNTAPITLGSGRGAGYLAGGAVKLLFAVGALAGPLAPLLALLGVIGVGFVRRGTETPGSPVIALSTAASVAILLGVFYH
jgi:hypothetical protein